MITLKGKIDWLHGLNPVKRYPQSVIVRVMNGDKEMICQEVTGDELWQWNFTLLQDKTSKFTLKVEVDEGYVVQIEGEDVICIHQSVELDCRGIPTGRFQGQKEIYIIPALICIG